MERFLRTLDDLLSFVKPMILMCLVLACPFLLAYKCSLDKAETARKAEFEASLEELREKQQMSQFIRDITKADKLSTGYGYSRIGDITRLQIGTRIYRDGHPPIFIGTILSISQNGVVIFKQQNKAGEALGLPYEPSLPEQINLDELRDYLIEGF